MCWLVEHLERGPYAQFRDKEFFIPLQLKSFFELIWWLPHALISMTTLEWRRETDSLYKLSNHVNLNEYVVDGREVLNT